MPIPVVIAENGRGLPVVEAEDGRGLPVVIAENGRGIPVVVAENGIGLPVTGLIVLARPTAPAFTATPGDDPGAVLLDLTALPSSWGDAVVPGDGLGAPGILQWRPHPGYAWQTLADPVPDEGDLPEEYEVEFPPELWGIVAIPAVRGVSDVGRAGAVATDTVLVPGEEPSEQGGFSSGFSSGFEVAA